MTQHPLADALRAIAEGNLGDMPWQADYERIRKVAAEALSQYEKSDTDRDQLREAAIAIIQAEARDLGYLEEDVADLDNPDGDDVLTVQAVERALASKTAIDPATVEAANQRAAEAEHRFYSYRQTHAARNAQLAQFIKDRAPDLWPDYAAVSVNGSLYREDYRLEPTFEREMNTLRYRAERAESELAAIRALGKDQ